MLIDVYHYVEDARRFPGGRVKSRWQRSRRTYVAKDILLGELFTYNALLDKLDDMSVRETLDYALNMAIEQGVVVYLIL